MSIESVNSATRATDRGTKIVKKGEEMDKNAFLKILTAELSNQNPDSAKDSTQYVAQLAQFSSLEQMANLNSTMSFAGAASLIGKEIKLNVLDNMGNLYSGVVKGTRKDGGIILLNVEVEENGEKIVKEFPYADVLQIGEAATSDEEVSVADSSDAQKAAD